MVRNRDDSDIEIDIDIDVDVDKEQQDPADADHESFPPIPSGSSSDILNINHNQLHGRRQMGMHMDGISEMNENELIVDNNANYVQNLAEMESNFVY